MASSGTPYPAPEPNPDPEYQYPDGIERYPVSRYTGSETQPRSRKKYPDATGVKYPDRTGARIRFGTPITPYPAYPVLAP